MTKTQKIVVAIIGCLAIIGLAGKFDVLPNKENFTTTDLPQAADEVFAEDDIYIKDNDYVTAQQALEVSNVAIKEIQGVYHVTGQIKNTSTVTIDDYQDLVIYNDATGDVERIKKIVVNLAPNETMYFDEIVGYEKPSTYVHIQ